MESFQIKGYRIIKEIVNNDSKVYHAVDEKTSLDVAIKYESTCSLQPSLFYEVKLYNQYLTKDNFPNEKGISNIYSYGSNDLYNFLVLDLFGPSLEKLFDECNKKFSLKTVLMLADQVITRLEFVHKQGLIFRGMKPANFVIGLEHDSSKIFIIDFGSSQTYMRNGKHNPYTECVTHVGNVGFCSINTHLGIETSRRDDLEALGYMLIYFLKGELPWTNIRRRDSSSSRSFFDKVMEKKLVTNIEKLCKDCPSEFQNYLLYTRELRFDEKPDYDFLRSKFKDLFIKSGFEYDYFYDWSPIELKKIENSKILQDECLNKAINEKEKENKESVEKNKNSNESDLKEVPKYEINHDQKDEEEKTSINNKSDKIQDNFEFDLKLKIKSYKLVKQIINEDCLVFQGLEEETNMDVAIKYEHFDESYKGLCGESKIYKDLCDDSRYIQNGIANFHKFGRNEYYSYLVLDLLGPSLEELFNKCNKKFCLKTVLILADQILCKLEYIHEKKYIFRGMKPANFLIGIGSNSSKIYIIDFGCSKKYIDDNGNHIPYKENKNPVGNPYYYSINTHLGIEQSRRDDLEALGYLLVYFLHGSLPWKTVNKPLIKDSNDEVDIEKIKMSTSIKILCENCPSEFFEYFNYVHNLFFEEQPDYNYLRKIFKNLFDTSGFQNDYLYDWTIMSNESLKIDLRIFEEKNDEQKNLKNNDITSIRPNSEEKTLDNSIDNSNPSEDSEEKILLKSKTLLKKKIAKSKKETKIQE